ncbi:sulfotransferase family 2 domain-containing protein [Nocardioides piscis]|uniref:Sulfotransferase family protein n=1 Tax=Nocardioides piscis TaxID=2714938 RepID=A0A6G7YIW3_9ACTN|nr:sulfotransferase family 2 domain-containing protein [Nocardioides piscis]QIK76683.1 sulfotransferase family protein [Nocardioides piscis]
MLISDERRMLFVHIPKTGGASIEQLLREACPDARTVGKQRHARLRRILTQHPELGDHWSFGFVRNPWARMVSWYSMIETWDRRWGPASGRPQDRQWGSTRDGNPLWRAVAEYADFEEFVLRGTSELERLAMPQLDYLVAGDRRADFIGRTESLGDDMAHVQRTLGLPVTPIPRRNTTSHGSYRDYYSPEARDRIGEVYARDIAEFGYDF